MTPLRRRMIEDMNLAGLASGSQQIYIKSVRRLAAHEVAGDLLIYSEKAGLDAFQINFHGNRDLDQLLQSMECFMQDVAPIVSGERIGSRN